MTDLLSDYVCPICGEMFIPPEDDACKCPHSDLQIFNWYAAEIERLRAALEKIAEFPDGYWIGQANLDYELSKRRGIARVALEKREVDNG